MGRGAGKMTGFANVTCFRDRHGKIRFRFRRKGCATVYLPGKPGDPEFAEAYASATQGLKKIEPGAGRTKPGTINALAVAFYASAEWRQLKPATQKHYRGTIERLRAIRGDFGVRGFQPRHVLDLRDRLADRPAAANNLVKVLRALMDFAVSRGWRPDDPTAGIKALKTATAGHHTWSEAEIAAFEAKWSVGTRERLAFDLMLYTVQRSGDVRQMGRQHIKDGRLVFTQEKTDAPLSLPILAPLWASIETVPANQMLFLQSSRGVAFTAQGFANWFGEACRAAGVPGTAHGLRKAGCTRLANAGHSEAEIMAWSGHQTAKEVQRYTRARDQKRLADRASKGLNQEQEMAFSSRVR